MKELSAKRLNTARNAIESARRDLAADAADFAADRAYYAMFYAAEALLADRDLGFSSHGALHGAFGREYSKTRDVDPKYHRWLLNAFKLRQSATYDAEVITASEQTRVLIEQAEEFVSAAEFYLKSSA